jgi:DNA-binding transcriptional ArsR family regulator
MDKLLENPRLTQDQLKALLDPIRIRIASCLKEPHSPKQVADILGVKANNLYHHFKVLMSAGIIELVETRQGKGFIKEDYYRLSQPSFRSSDDEETNPARQQMLFGMFQALIDDFQLTAARYDKPVALGAREDFTYSEDDLLRARNIVEKHTNILRKELAELSNDSPSPTYQLSIFCFRV